MRISLISAILLLSSSSISPAYAGNWGGYVYHEGETESSACHEAKKHALELCEKNGETFNINSAEGSCKLVNKAQHNNKAIFLVNLVFSCHGRQASISRTTK